MKLLKYKKVGLFNKKYDYLCNHIATPQTQEKNYYFYSYTKDAELRKD